MVCTEKLTPRSAPPDTRALYPHFAHSNKNERPIEASLAPRHVVRVVWSGGLAGTRTRDQRLKRPLLYRLSYQPAMPHAFHCTGNEPALKRCSKSAANLINKDGPRKSFPGNYACASSQLGFSACYLSKTRNTPSREDSTSCVSLWHRQPCRLQTHILQQLPQPLRGDLLHAAVSETNVAVSVVHFCRPAHGLVRLQFEQAILAWQNRS